MPAQERSPGLRAAWDAEEDALERGDVEGASRAVAEAWAPPGPLRERVEAMQRRAFELQLAAGDVEDGPDPADEDPDAFAKLDMAVVAAAGSEDFPDFIEGAEELARLVPGARSVVIDGAGHLIPLEAPKEFRELVRLTLR
jgi:pimeloyl-ACP methyl ester carboxylesterase